MHLYGLMCVRNSMYHSMQMKAI